MLTLVVAGGQDTWAQAMILLLISLAFLFHLGVAAVLDSSGSAASQRKEKGQRSLPRSTWKELLTAESRALTPRQREEREALVFIFSRIGRDTAGAVLAHAEAWVGEGAPGQRGASSDEAGAPPPRKSGAALRLARLSQHLRL